MASVPSSCVFLRSFVFSRDVLCLHAVIEKACLTPKRNHGIPTWVFFRLKP